MTETRSAKRYRMPDIAKGSLVVAVLLWVSASDYSTSSARFGPGSAVAIKRDDAASSAAFKEAYKVLMHPRCMNCHPSGDAAPG